MLGIYIRLSREDEESNSLENQLREGKSFAKKYKLPYEVYNEGQGISGRSDIKDRPQLDKLMRDIATGKISTVWMRNQNRLERNSMTFHVFADIVIRHKITVVFGDKEMDWDDPSNFLQSSILTAINSYQAHLQSFQTKKSLSDNAKEGKAHGIPPYGYTKDDEGYLVIDDEEAKVVRLIYELSLKGTGTRSLAEKLEAEGVPTRYNKIGTGTLTFKNKHTGKLTTKEKSKIKWAGNTIRGIIKNPIYKGERNFGGKTYDAPAIFDEVYWSKVNDNLKNNQNNTGKKVEHKYLLKGLLICGKCGRNYYGRTRVNKKDNYYMCSSKRYKSENCGNRSLNIDVLESFIWMRFFKTTELQKLITEHLKSSSNNEKIEQLEADLATFERALGSLSNERENAVKLAIKGLLKEEDIQPEMERIDRAILDLKTKVKNVKEQLDSYSQIDKKVAEIGTDLGQIKKSTSFNDKRDIIRKYIKSITILYREGWYTLEIAFSINGMPVETYEIDKLYKVAIQVDSSGNRIVVHLKTGELTYHPKTDIYFGEI